MIKKSYQRSIIFTLLLVLLSCTSSFSYKLQLREISSIQNISSKVKKDAQIPHSTVAIGKKNIKAAWLSGATNRYAHGILGDDIEATRLMVESSTGKILSLNLPSYRVFEDLMPRLVDINRNGKDEILVIESDRHKGASLAVYGIIKNRIVKISSTPFIGKANRWLNPVGVGDFNDDKKPDIAIIETPHIGGVLKLFTFTGSSLKLYAQSYGVSNHRIGSTHLGLATVVKSLDGDLILVPDQFHRKMLLLKWTKNGFKTLAKIDLKGRLNSSLILVQKNVWQLKLANGKSYELRLEI